MVRVRRSQLRAGPVRVPGDPSQAAFWIVAALLAPDSRVTVEGIYLGRERVGYLGVLDRMGARLEVAETGPAEGSVTASTSALRATDVEAAEIPSLDEVPILAVAASRAQGTHPVPGRGRAPGQGVRPSGRDGGTGHRLRRDGRRRR